MRVVVPVRQVARLDDEGAILGDGSGVEAEALEFELNEWDHFSLEAGVELAGVDGEVVVVTVGDEGADEALRTCLAKGAQRAIRIWDHRLDGIDSLAIAFVLAAAVQREQPDLVLCGVQSSDAVTGSTGVALAAHLGLPRVAVVKRIEREEGALHVDRELEGGLLEVVRVQLPALLTIQTGINQPRYATLRAIKQAEQKPLAVMELEDLGLTPSDVAAAGGSRTRRYLQREAGDTAEMISGPSPEVAARIAQIVKESMGQ